MTAMRQIRRFIAETFHPPETLTDETSLTESAILDATGLLAVRAFLDRRFGLRIAATEAAQLDSIARLAAYVERRRTAAR